MNKKIRPLGHITQDLEPLLLELAEQHDMQVYEIIGIIYTYLQVHCPQAIERYLDGSTPQLFYGDLNGMLKGLRK